MSLPYSEIVGITGKVQSASFTVEKKHMLLAMDNSLIPTSVPYIEFLNITAFRTYFGSSITEYAQVQKYFSWLSKTGIAPEKLVVARWFKDDTAPFYKGINVTETVAVLELIESGSFKISLTGAEFEVVVNLDAVTSYSDIAGKIEDSIQANVGGGVEFTGATCTYNSITGGFIITSGSAGKEYTVESVTAGTTGTDLSTLLGLLTAELSQGVDAETYAEFCDRIYQSNSAGYSITTLETLTNDEITDAVEWLQTVANGQTYFTAIRLVFNIGVKATAESLQTSLIALEYTGYVVCYDPNGEYVNILDCSICATIDYEAENGAINFNFQSASGYTSLTNYGTVVDYQAGNVNSALFQELNGYKLNFVYSVGFGSNETLYYGTGLMAGAFATEDAQVNESWLEKDIQVNVMNAFDSLNKIKLRGSDAVDLMSSIISPSFNQGKLNGTIANNGVLSDSDKLSIYQATANINASESVANNGYYFVVSPLTQADIDAKRVRITSCYLTGGVVNYVRVINNIYGN